MDAASLSFWESEYFERFPYCSEDVQQYIKLQFLKQSY